MAFQRNLKKKVKSYLKFTFYMVKFCGVKKLRICNPSPPFQKYTISSNIHMHHPCSSSFAPFYPYPPFPICIPHSTAIYPSNPISFTHHPTSIRIALPQLYPYLPIHIYLHIYIQEVPALPLKITLHYWCRIIKKQSLMEKFSEPINNHVVNYKSWLSGVVGTYLQC